jgi:hypothetical protein
MLVYYTNRLTMCVLLMQGAVIALLKEQKEKEELLSTLQERLYTETMERALIINRIKTLEV